MILQYCCSGFPHSDICGSMDICSFPQLFAACHVLLRLLMPRHSSYALLRLTSSESSLPAPFCFRKIPLLRSVPPLPKKTGFFRILLSETFVSDFLSFFLFFVVRIHLPAPFCFRKIPLLRSVPPLPKKTGFFRILSNSLLEQSLVLL